MNPTIRPNRQLESRAWTCAKHAIQLAMVGAAVLLVLEGGRAPLMAFAWAGAAFVALVCMVLIDRQRFEEAGYVDAFEVVEVIGFDQAPLTLDAPLQGPAAAAYGYRYPSAAEVAFIASVT